MAPRARTALTNPMPRPVPPVPLPAPPPPPDGGRPRVLEEARGKGRLLLTPDEAAEALGLRVGYLARLRSKGGGPRFVRLGGKHIRYAPKDLEAWIEERTAASTSDESYYRKAG